MSGHADPLAQSVTDRKRSIAALSVEFIRALQILLGSAGRSVFSLDKSLSWMPLGAAWQQMSRPKTASFGRGSEAAAQVRVASIVASGEEIKML
jgi:hypothetical protein